MTKYNITPAELQLLVAMHQGKGETVEAIEETDEIDRDEVAEISRLRQLYKLKAVNTMYGTVSKPNLPESFEEAVKVGANTQLPQGGTFITVGDRPSMKGDE